MNETTSDNRTIPCHVCEGTHDTDGHPCHICCREEYQVWKIERDNLAQYGRQFAQKDLSNFETKDPDTKKALKTANEYIVNLSINTQEGRGLTIIGPVGTGKTHLAVGIKKAALRHGVGFAIVDCLNLIIQCKRAIKKEGGDEYVVLDQYADFPNLILDDFGIDKGSSDWVEECWYYLVNKRYINCRATIITSNQRFAEMEAGLGYYGPRIVSRIKEMNGRAVSITSSDFRVGLGNGEGG